MNRVVRQQGIILPGIIIFLVLLAVGGITVLNLRHGQPKIGPPLSPQSTNNPLQIGSFIVPRGQVDHDIADIFLAYHRGAASELTVEKINRLQNVLPSYHPQTDGYKLEVLDKDNKVLDSLRFTIPNEQPDLNDLRSGTGMVHVIKLDQVNFFLKVPAPPQAKSVRISDPQGKQITIESLPKYQKSSAATWPTIAKTLSWLLQPLHQPVYAQMPEKRCHRGKPDLCVSVKVNKTEVAVGDSVTITWEASGVGPKGAVALNTDDMVLNRFVESTGSKVFWPFLAKDTYITLSVDDGEGYSLTTDKVKLTVKPPTVQTYGFFFISQKYPKSSLLQFDQDVKRFKDYLLTYEPFKSRADQLRFYTIDNIFVDFKEQVDDKNSKAIKSIDNEAFANFINRYKVANMPQIIIITNRSDAQGMYNILPSTQILSNAVDPLLNPFFVFANAISMGLQIESLYKYENETLVNNTFSGEVANCWAGTPESVPAAWNKYSDTFYQGCGFTNWIRTSENSILRDLTHEYFNKRSQEVINDEITRVLTLQETRKG